MAKVIDAGKPTSVFEYPVNVLKRAFVASVVVPVDSSTDPDQRFGSDGEEAINNEAEFFQHVAETNDELGSEELPSPSE